MGSNPDPAGVEEGFEIVKDLACEGFMEGAHVAPGMNIQLEALQLDAQRLGHILEHNGSEVRLARLGA
jgi:hypothetical protein